MRSISLILSCKHISSLSGLGTPKPGFHLRNQHKFGYDIPLLTNAVPELCQFVQNNKAGQPSFDFSNARTLKYLNYAMLKAHYNVNYWDIPENYLCPSVPSRADYIHRIADLIDSKPVASVVGLDIGVGSSCIYPIIGVAEYNWKFVGSEIDDTALAAAQQIVDANLILKGNVELRKQRNENHIFRGVLTSNDRFDFCVANPPFHRTMAAARRGTERKWRNLDKVELLSRGKDRQPELNFGGSSHELCYEGGEIGFITKMIKESSDQFVKERVKLFTALVSSKDSLPIIYRLLDKVNDIEQVYTVEMTHGQKRSRIVAWHY